MEENNKQEEMFRQLVLQFHSAALIQLGQVKNPQTDKFEKNLSQAQYFIDMLDMLQAKTVGNLTKEDADLLSHTITNLKTSFVNESRTPQTTSEDDRDQTTKGEDPEPKKKSKAKKDK